jgi:hypothetical protein
MTAKSVTPTWKTALSDGVSQAPAALPANLRVRSVGIADAGHQRRTDWLNTWVTNSDHFTFSPENMRILAQAWHSYDVIILHGDDPAAMAPILRQWRTVLRSKAIVAVLPHSTGDADTVLLNSGADTVIDLSDPPVLASAMVCTLIRRIHGDDAIDLA